MADVIDFTKMHGAGNDFILLDGIRSHLPALEPLAAALCDRHLGIGADQILVARPSKQADFYMEIFNADGSKAEMCANGIRAFLKYLRDQGFTQQEEVAVETLGGVVRPRWIGPDQVRIEMQAPILEKEQIPTLLGQAGEPVIDVALSVGDQTVSVSSVSMGNPHAVLYVDKVDEAPVRELGPQIENHPAFPNRVNVEFVEVINRNRLRQRTWERGTGETLACGSGACAVAVVSILRKQVESPLNIALRGGELQLEWSGIGEPVYLSGPAAEVYRGQFPIPGA